MNQMTLKAAPRDAASRGELRKLRHGGRIPGVVYGKNEAAPIPIAVEAKELHAMLRTHSRAVLNLEIAGYGRRSVLLTDLQRDKISGEVMHIDLHKINLNETIKAPVRLEASGKSAGEQEGGMLQMVLHELEVECLPSALPESIMADVSRLQVGDTLTVADLTLPEGVKTLQEPDTVVAAVLAPQKEISEDEAAAMDDAEEEGAKQAKSAQTLV